MSVKNMTVGERNAIVWLERQIGVTSVVPSRRHGARHRHKPGFVKVVEDRPTGVLLRTYDTGTYRDLFVHAKAGTARDAWMRQLLNGHAEVPAAGSVSSSLKHTVEKAQNFSPDVPAPKPTDSSAGQLFKVTPEIAAKWLERNTRNRALRQDVVFRYASDMREGRWMVTGDAIAFDSNGAVVNGQHRLWAVLESGCTIEMLVTFGLDPDVVYVLDDHLKRSLTDVVRIGSPGSSISSAHSGISKAMMFNLWSAADKSGVLRRTSRQKQIEFMERHLPAIEFVLKDCFHSHKQRGLTTSAMMAVMARAYYTQDRDRLKEFAQVLAKGITESHGDDAAILLRNWLMRLNTQGVRASGDVIYRKTERALWLFFRKERARNLTEATAELFLLPEETTTSKVRRA